MKPIEEFTTEDFDRLQPLLDEIDLMTALEEKSNEEIALYVLQMNDFRIGTPHHALLMEVVERLAPDLTEERITEWEASQE